MIAAVGSREQPAWGPGEPGRGCHSAQAQNTSHQASNIFIGGDEPFGMQLSERDVERPLLVADSAEAIEGQIETLADAHPGGAEEQERQTF